MSGASRPERRRVYQNHHLDSTRWDSFRRRPGDIVIGTSYKAGTTWTQSIVAHLLFPPEGPPGNVGDLSPWLDMRLLPLDTVLAGLEAQTHRRFVKTHLPFDALPYDETLQYIYVARDARDVFMSLWNHYRNYTDEMFQLLNDVPGRVGAEMPLPPDDIHEFWRNWITRGWFEWEGDGWPYWSHLYNVRSWWEQRSAPNILLLHYSDLLEDLGREMRRIADFLEVAVPESSWPGLVRQLSFAEMKQQGARYAPGGGLFWKGGADTFLHKGTNGRWRELLDADELALYDAACARELPPACRRWMEQGGPLD